jgi:hypothetical protein
MMVGFEPGDGNEEVRRAGYRIQFAGRTVKFVGGSLRENRIQNVFDVFGLNNQKDVSLFCEIGRLGVGGGEQVDQIIKN